MISAAPDSGAAPEFDKAALEKGRLLFAAECQFVAGAMADDQLPGPSLPEVAFAGRSNVGKSSLVNALTGRKTLARVSNTPGRTQQLNFFDLGGRLMLVDLPGYGYSQAGKSAAKAWTRLALNFLKGRATLRRVMLLIDSRHGLKESDTDIMDLFDASAVVYQVVLTKADKTEPADLDKTRAAVLKSLSRRVAAHPVLHITSSAKALGIAELRAELAALV